MDTTVTAGWTVKLAGQHGTFLVLAVDKGGRGPCLANLPGRENTADLGGPGPVLTVRMLGRPGADEFNVSLGEIDFRNARSPGGNAPWAHMGMYGQFTPRAETGACRVSRFSRELTYYPPPEPEAPEPGWEPAPDDVHTLRHGYNLADLGVLARMAVGRVRASTIRGTDAYDLAWSAITETLYASENPVDPPDLITAGAQAIWRELAADMRHHGKKAGTGPGERGANFAAYWDYAGRHTASPETVIVEKTALWQIWPVLTDGDRKAFLALASTGDYGKAAAALGVSYSTFVAQVGRGRKRFYRLWHEGEEPSRPWGNDRRGARANGVVVDIIRQRGNRKAQYARRKASAPAAQDGAA